MSNIIRSWKKLKVVVVVGMILLMIANIVCEPLFSYAFTNANLDDSSSNKSYYSLNQTIYDGDNAITVVADAGVYPAGSYVVATRVENQTDKIEDAVNEAIESEDSLKQSAQASLVVAYDIEIHDKNGNVIENPDLTKGNISVSIKAKDLEEDKTYEVFHVTDDFSEAQQMDAQILGNDIAVFDVEHFSLYVLIDTSNEAADGKSGVTAGDSVAGTTDAKYASEDQIFNSPAVAMYKKADNTYAPITNGVEIPNATDIKIDFEINPFIVINNGSDITGQYVEDLWAAAPGAVYKIAEIPVGKFDLSKISGNIPIEIGGTKVADAVIDKTTGDVTLVMSSSLTPDTDKKFTNGKFSIVIDLNTAAVDGDGKIDLKCEFLGNVPLTVPVEEYKPAKPTVTKTAINSAPGVITWQIEVKNPKRLLPGITSMSIKDTLVSEELSYIPGTMKKSIDGGALSPISDPSDVSSDGFSIAGVPITSGQTTVYTFDTEVDFSKATPSAADIAAGKVTLNNLTNNADLYTNLSSTTPIDTDDAITQNEYNFASGVTISKSGGDADGTCSESGGKPKFKWVITVDVTNPVKNLKIFDDFLTDSLSDISMRKCNDVTPTVQKNGSSFTGYSYDEAGPGYKMCWTIADADVGKYEITYYTYMENWDKFIKNVNESAPENRAWVSYVPPVGTGTGPDPLGPYVGPPVNRRAGVSPYAIHKLFESYDPSTQVFTWTIEVNPNKALYPNGLWIRDRIEHNQVYYDDNKAPIPYTINGSYAGTLSYIVPEPTTNTSSNGVWENHKYEYDRVWFRLDESTISGKTVKFTVKTKLKDSEIANWADNKSFRLDKDGNVIKNFSTIFEDYVGEKETVSSTAVVPDSGLNSSMLKKEVSTAYKYSGTDRHTVTYDITVNENKMYYPESVVTDNLGSKGMELVDIAFTSDGSTPDLSDTTHELATSGSDSDNYYTNVDGLLSIHLAEIPNSVVGTDDALRKIRIKAKVTDEYLQTLAKGDSQIVNEVTLSTVAPSNYPTVTDDAEFTIKNSVVDKTKVSTSGNTASYRVIVNQAGTLLEDGFAIIDELPEGMKFVVDDVVVNKCLVNEDSGEVDSETPLTLNSDYKLTFTDDDTVMTVEFIDPQSNTFSVYYKAKLLIDPASYAEYINKASASGFNSGKFANDSVSMHSSDWASINLDLMYFAKVNKIDKEDNTVKLSGAVFQLWETGGSTDKTTWTKVITGTTLDDGSVTFMDLDKTKKYAVTEIVAPAGYDLCEDVWDITLTSPGRDNAATYTFEDSKTKPSPSPTPGGDPSGDPPGGTPSPSPTPGTHPDPPGGMGGDGPDKGPSGDSPSSNPPSVNSASPKYNANQADSADQTVAVEGVHSPKTGEFPVIPVSLGLMSLIVVAILLLEKKRRSM